ncbi:hypothetical protein [Thalassovita aquimarina]|uniref:STAS domain-containing protein n=1 Tax=Thalassovita aquimarina TaxID=2785917 RepID=A0ABS5HTW1_9RHOB|nr:hypothetical protein [Thalassovita aquimarina]MBR9652366.1 hypothetical protein [Thalassovita aquimarina]
MPETALQITLDGSSTFEALVPLRDALAEAPEGAPAELAMDVAEDVSPSVLFALGQVLCAAKKENRVDTGNLSALADRHAPFGAMLARTGFGSELTE